jgi:hypothetical protein
MDLQIYGYRFYILIVDNCVWNFEGMSDEDERNPVVYLGSRAFNRQNFMHCFYASTKPLAENNAMYGMSIHVYSAPLVRITVLPYYRTSPLPKTEI